MPARKKSKQKVTASKKTARKMPPVTKAAKLAKKLAKKTAPRRAEKIKASSKKQARKKRARLPAPAFAREAPESRSGDLSGDLQGLSRLPVADSESVDELLEEGNAFEADAVIGVEDAGRSGVREVRTHEVPEDDVPSEYLDEE